MDYAGASVRQEGGRTPCDNIDDDDGADGDAIEIGYHGLLKMRDSLGRVNPTGLCLEQPREDAISRYTAGRTSTPTGFRPDRRRIAKLIVR